MSDETTQTTPPEWTGEFDEIKAGRRLAGAKLDAARNAVATLDGVVRWAAYEDEQDMMENSLVDTTGPALKALGDGKVGGHLVMFGDDNTTDLSPMSDWFAPDTDYDLEEGKGRTTAYYHHGMDPVMKKRKLGGRATLGIDDVGVWMEHQLNMRDEYERAVYGMVEAGKMGLSSGAPPHLVEREARPNGSHKVTRWPIAEASYTPIPAEPRIRVMTMKTYLDMAEPYVKALPQVDALQAPTADATKATPEPDQPTHTTGEYDMTPEEMQTLIAQAAKDAAAEAIKAYQAEQPAINPAGFAVTQPATVKDKPEAFKSLGEQLDAVRRAMTPGYSMDRRLAEMKAISGMSETVTEDGGYLVQTDFATELLRRTYDTGVLTSRVRRIPIGANANGLTINAVAETSRATGSRWGGVQVYWREEAGTVTNKQPAFRRMKLELNSLMGLCYATDELLADSVALSSVIQQAFAEEFAFTLDDAIIRGSGNGQPLGILNSSAYVSVTKETNQVADTIYWENVLKMWSRLWSRSRGNAVWFIHQDTLPQLATMAQVIGVGGVPVYLPATGAAAMPYSTLFGRPVIEIEQADTVGDQGDIMLADLSQYLMIEKGGLEAAQSIHVRFLYGENTFRFILRADGQPIWHSPLTLFNSSTTVSPFVLLDARA